MASISTPRSTFLQTLDPICVALSAETAEALHSRAAAAFAAGSRFLELRLDGLREPRQGIECIHRLRSSYPDGVLLATCRRQPGGGSFPGSIAEQFAILAEAAAAGARLVDVELETLEAAEPAALAALAALASRLNTAGAAVVVSAHDFAATGDLHATLHRLQALGAPLRPALYKVVSTATCLADTLRMLTFLEEASRETAVVGMCMGEMGIPSRVLAVRAGGRFTFAAADGTAGTAPGQLSAARMRDEFRVPELGPSTKIYGLAGNPVAHSLSPAMHNAAFRQAGVDAVYLPLHTTSVDDLWQLMEGLPLAGLSVTMPWKSAVMPRLDAIDPVAQAAGAVNTIVRRADGSLFGTNTDIAAVVQPIAERVPLRGAPVLVVGAGGAARAAVFGLRAAGAEVTILNRSREAAALLAEASGSRVADRDHPFPAGQRCYSVIVNTTPAGMEGPLRDMLAVDAAALEGAQLVFESVYRPAETPLTRLARERGIPVIAGAEMFLRQGMRQWELWTGQQPPRACMHAVLQAALEP